MGIKTRFISFVKECKNLWDNLWTVPRERLSKRMSHLVHDTRVVVHTLRSYQDRKISFQAAALSFHSAIALIPMLAIFFALTSGFGLADQLKEFLYSKIPAEPDIIDMIMLAAENIVDAAKSGLFGLISVLTFVWSVIWLFMRVEEVFNNVWNVRKGNRNFFKRFGVDLIILITIPFVIAIFFAGSVVYSHVLDLLVPSIPGITGHIKSFLSWLILATVVVMTFSSMFKFIPATKVKYKNALKGALVAGVVFTGLQYLYLETQVMVTKMNAFYGTVAAIPLFLIWLNYSWQTVLYGAQLSCALQNVEEIESKI